MGSTPKWHLVNEEMSYYEVIEEWEIVFRSQDVVLVVEQLIPKVT